MLVTSCGVRDTDKGRIHRLGPCPTPGVLGQETARIVEAIGSRVTLVRPGSRVMISMSRHGECPTRQRGEPRYCRHDLALTFSGYRLDA
jgi:aryl-alcohol dehydrogenase